LEEDSSISSTNLGIGLNTGVEVAIVLVECKYIPLKETNLQLEKNTFSLRAF
jgi:hypothetical protein